ncbi:hypothetical protein ABZ079_29765 [Streptomyces sp. NPDC006314]|uniref:hypothetical protein n=1 Tax=Streptomyces sp. NPDC006314 TaxID=3154475 RepID=UPI0033BC7290
MKAVRVELRRRRSQAVIARKGSPDVKGRGKLRYVVEQTFALLQQLQRLAVRWERRIELHDSFLSLAHRKDLSEAAPHCYFRGGP